MSAIKIVKNKKQRQQKNSLMIQEEIFPKQMQVELEQKISNAKDSKSGYILLTLMMILCLGFVAYFFEIQEKKEQTPSQAFIVLKTLDPLGHPLAGVRISNEGNELGMTDTFGEWRKFISAQAGEKIVLQASKESISLYGQKEFLIPNVSSSKGEIELNGTIQLSSKKTKNNQGTKSNTVSSSLKIIDTTNHAPLKSTKKSEESNAMSVDFQSIAINVNLLEIDQKRFDAYDIAAAKELEKLVLPEMKKYLESVGMKVDDHSPFKMNLKHLPRSANSTSNGVTMVTVTVPGNDKKIVYLKNYLNTPQLTAKSIIAGFKQHSAKKYSIVKKEKQWMVVQKRNVSSLWSLEAGDQLVGKNGQRYLVAPDEVHVDADHIGHLLIDQDTAPCAAQQNSCFLFSTHIGNEPPTKGWIRLKVQVYGMPEDATLFVSGVEAQYEGGKVWSYWGQYDLPVNLTVVREGVVYVRQKIVAEKGKIPLVNLPVSSYSKGENKEWVR